MSSTDDLQSDLEAFGAAMALLTERLREFSDTDGALLPPPERQPGPAAVVPPVPVPAAPPPVVTTPPRRHAAAWLAGSVMVAASVVGIPRWLPVLTPATPAAPAAPAEASPAVILLSPAPVPVPVPASPLAVDLEPAAAVAAVVSPAPAATPAREQRLPSILPAVTSAPASVAAAPAVVPVAPPVIPAAPPAPPGRTAIAASVRAEILSSDERWFARYYSGDTAPAGLTSERFQMVDLRPRAERVAPATAGVVRRLEQPTIEAEGEALILGARMIEEVPATGHRSVSELSEVWIARGKGWELLGVRIRPAIGEAQ
jgi:hypothetical protein